ncbi:melanophilin isoform X2 [Alligator sinensis]|uniref:Melanophilin isoform X2 n=1 Tax=Alligator sinensis TaxID=38654 RepID=A0A3Q0HDH8_ALLSI|nr:melanophilin isoform X2 [Alligator sinensis]
MGRKLDLSKLTDEEAKHVWEVVQRDLDLRKKEEERLEDLKGKIERESTKREFLSNQSHLNETHCVHCLQPFKFLVNSKRQCLDCHFYTCKNCSRYNKKDQGWVCDPCRLSRVVKIGSLEWYYEHVRSRFKRFGSAKVMRSLCGRLQPGQGMNPALLGLHDRVYSLPDINNRERHFRTSSRGGEDSDDDVIGGAEAECYNRMRKTKRLLSVHPFDFDLDSEYSAQSRRQSMQLSPAAINQDGLQSYPDFPDGREDMSQKESLIAEADLASMFHHILQEQGQHLAPPEQEFSTEVRLTVNSRRKSLERNPNFGSLWNRQHPPHYSADMDTSDEDVKGAHKLPHHIKRRNRASSQESINHSGNQILELNKRMSAIERMLNRLEEKVLVPSEESPGQEPRNDPDVEEEELKKKLEELASNISDKGVSSEEEEGKKEEAAKPEMSSSSDDLPSEAQQRSSAKVLCDITAKVLRAINATEKAVHKSLSGDDQCDVASPFLRGQPSSLKDGKEATEAYQKLEENVYMTAGKTYGLEKMLKDIEERARHSGTTDSELSELEDKVASAAAQVQHAESEVSDIETRIAALSAAGMTVKPMEKAKKKSSMPVLTLHSPRHGNSQGDQNMNSPFITSPNDVKVMSMPQVLQKKFNSSFETAGDESFDRQSLYRGSLTQRNPNGRSRRAERIFAKPVMTHRP